MIDRQMTLPMELDTLSRHNEEARRQRVEAWLKTKGDPARVLTRALSIQQPWLKIIMLGLKTWEFRSWPHGHPGWTIALHAAKRFEQDWRRILRDAGAVPDAIGDVGAFCAVATLGDCVPLGARPYRMPHDVWEDLINRQLRVLAGESGRPLQGSDKIQFAWELCNVIPIDPALLWKGQLGMWPLPARAREQIIERVRL